VRRKTFSVDAISPIQAAEQMADLDHDFLLFRDVETGADAVAYVRDDGCLGVILPIGIELPQPQGDSVGYEHSRLTGSITLDNAVAEMDQLNHRFLYFVNADTGRGTVLYLRHDGHYGLIEPVSGPSGSPPR
jgi:hypothetical protein